MYLALVCVPELVPIVALRVVPRSDIITGISRADVQRACEASTREEQGRDKKWDKRGGEFLVRPIA